MNPDEQLLAAEGGRAFLAAVQLRGQPGYEVEEHLDELAELAESAGLEVTGRAIQARPAPHPATFVGPGKAEEIKVAMTELGSTLVVFDDDLSPSQVAKLEKILEVPVVDRSVLILQIFQQRARTKEAKTQVELARLHYLLPRLTRYWKHLGRQAGGIGLRGGEGEKQLETDRRLLRRRIGQYEKELVRIARTRETQRRGRRHVREVALAGYTNVGKSTLFNRLTKDKTLVQDRLFATLDPRLRRGGVGGADVVVFSDTVGFIRKLPHHLVAAFRSTLEQVRFADLVLHVVDVSHPGWSEQERVASEVLTDLGVDADRIVTVFNKVDLTPQAPGRRGDDVYCSAVTGEGLDQLRGLVRERLFGPREDEALLAAGNPPT